MPPGGWSRVVGRIGFVTEQQSRLATELEFYNLRKREWLQQHSGEYVVLRGRDVLGFYPAFSDAYTAGARAWGTGTDFLVRQVLEHEPIFLVF
jgi:hypothetical protein